MRIQRRGGVVDVDLAMADIRRWLGLPTEAEIANAHRVRMHQMGGHREDVRSN